jgi:DNA-binding CsgD family transcriptional regulator
MLAIDIGFSWYLRGEEAMGSGWISRAQRLLEGESDCVEHGYLQTLAIDEALAVGDFAAAIDEARAVGAVGARHADETLCSYALVGEGVALIKHGRVRDGLAALDEAMLPVVAGRVRPTWAGNIYCQLMSVCHELADLRRARQWTDATAHEYGKDPQPGLALVWVAEGRPADAVEALLACAATTPDPLAKARLWEALVEAAIAAEDPSTARRAADALDEAAATYGSAGLVAAATQSRGRVCVAAGEPDRAIEHLRRACQHWRDLDAPYRAARARLDLARALDQVEDEHGATLEREAATSTLTRLGVTVAVGTRAPVALPDGITRREAEVLALVAQGLTNRDVADKLVLSERTVARHLANLYTKIGVTSRTAATTYAHRHGLVEPSSA